MGWIGIKSQALHFLATVGADRDEKGNFKLVGPPGSEPVTFLGDDSPGAEMVLDDKVCYLVGGKPCALAAGLGGTSYGMRVHVI